MNKACENRSSGDNTNEFQPGLQQHLMRSNTACKRFFDAQETRMHALAFNSQQPIFMTF